MRKHGCVLLDVRSSSVLLLALECNPGYHICPILRRQRCPKSLITGALLPTLG